MRSDIKVEISACPYRIPIKNISCHFNYFQSNAKVQGWQKVTSV